ncbi:MAG TPA: protein translocase subunit SecF [Terriglobia bacterium]|nr:protein translocase subunit SecF [Terriglobia bacterium]
MEFFRSPKIDWIGKKWYFIAVSLVLGTAGMVSLISKGGPRYGVDFRGGTIMQVKFRETPNLDRLRAALASQGLGGSTLQTIGAEDQREILISLELQAQTDDDLDAGRRRIAAALHQEFGGGDKPNWNEASSDGIAERLADSPALRAAGLSPEGIRDLAQRMVSFRDSAPRGGLIGSFEELRAVPGVTPELIAELEAQYSLPGFAIRNVEIVGPRVGAALRRQAVNATLLGMAAMLVYIAFRFEWIYGIAAVASLVHDVVVAVGFLSLFNMEISLTVIAALLTLVGYSVNDSVVIFDRIRENVRLMRRDRITEIANRSINQTLSRTVLTGIITLATSGAMFLWGGEVLRGFAFTLLVGILVGTYSTISVACPLAVSWIEYTQRERRGGAEAVAAERRGKAKASPAGAGVKG